MFNNVDLICSPLTSWLIGPICGFFFFVSYGDCSRFYSRCYCFRFAEINSSCLDSRYLWRVGVGSVILSTRSDSRWWLIWLTTLGGHNAFTHLLLPIDAVAIRILGSLTRSVQWTIQIGNCAVRVIRYVVPFVIGASRLWTKYIKRDIWRLKSIVYLSTIYIYIK